jgi:hypothetical protein
MGHSPSMTNIPFTALANSQTTQLTPNSNSVAVGSGDPNLSTLININAPVNGITYWAPSVSTGFKSVTLSADTGNSTVTFKKGLKVTLNQIGSTGYNVLLDGEIVDNGTVYPVTGTLIYQSTGS